MPVCVGKHLRVSSLARRRKGSRSIGISAESGAGLGSQGRMWYRQSDEKYILQPIEVDWWHEEYINNGVGSVRPRAQVSERGGYQLSGDLVGGVCPRGVPCGQCWRCLCDMLLILRADCRLKCSILCAI